MTCTHPPKMDLDSYHQGPTGPMRRPTGLLQGPFQSIFWKLPPPPLHIHVSNIVILVLMVHNSFEYFNSCSCMFSVSVVLRLASL
jgi:hypothetical protein